MEFELIASIVAVLVAFFALGVTIWQGVETRKNYRLSVTPHVNCTFSFTTSNEYSGISIENKGIGPAILLGIDIKYSGRNYNFLERPGELINDIKKDLFIKSKVKNFHCCVLDANDYLSVDEKIPLIYIEKPADSDIETLHKIFSDLQIQIKYSSIYGQTYIHSFDSDLKNIMRRSGQF